MSAACSCIRPTRVPARPHRSCATVKRDRLSPQTSTSVMSKRLVPPNRTLTATLPRDRPATVHTMAARTGPHSLADRLRWPHARPPICGVQQASPPTALSCPLRGVPRNVDGSARILHGVFTTGFPPHQADATRFEVVRPYPRRPSLSGSVSVRGTWGLHACAFTSAL